jgi:hypothetical protein
MTTEDIGSVVIVVAVHRDRCCILHAILLAANRDGEGNLVALMVVAVQLT